MFTRWQQRLWKWTEPWSGLWPYSCVKILLKRLLLTHCRSFDVDRRLVFGIVCDYLPSVVWFCVSNKQCVYLSFGFLLVLLKWKLWFSFLCSWIMKVKLFFALSVYFVLRFCNLSCFKTEVKVLCQNGHNSILCENNKEVVLSMLLYKKMTNPLDNFSSHCYCWK